MMNRCMYISLVFSCQAFYYKEWTVFILWVCIMNIFIVIHTILGSIVVSILVCHAGDRGSIPRQGVCFYGALFFMPQYSLSYVA